MHQIDDLELSIAIADIAERLAARGLHLFQVSDLSRASRMLDQMGADTNDITRKGAPYVTLWLDPIRNALSSNDSFWLFIEDDAGKIVGKLGTRLDRVGSEPFKAYAGRALMAHHRDDRRWPGADRLPDVMNEITGNVAYCGDLYIDPSIRSLDPSGLMVLLNYMLMRFKFGVPDYSICYVRRAHWEQWEWVREFWHWEANACDFSFAPESDFRGLMFGYLSAADFDRLILAGLARLKKPVTALENRMRDDHHGGSEPARKVARS